MLAMMDKDEIIILSSDDDDESNVRQFERCKPYVANTQNPNRKWKNYSIEENYTRLAIKRKFNTIIKNGGGLVVNNKVPKVNCKNGSKECPVVVDLEDCLDKTPNVLPSDCRKTGKAKHVQSHFNDVIDIDAGEDEPKTPIQQDFNVTISEADGESLSIKIESTQGNVTSHDESNSVKPEENGAKTEVQVPEKLEENSDTKSETFDQNLKPFTEFVELCGSLEDIANDRIRLTKKLMKRYGEADLEYVKSEEFRLLVEQCKKKVNKNNLYLIAKDITAELTFRKKINLAVGDSNQTNNSQDNCESAKKMDPVLEKEMKQARKRSKFINKILKKLDKLGSKIRELEEKEVDLSDEEESAYVQLQRYRDRFCQIYKKLCKYTNEIPHADRVYNRKICFTESKYPAINKCIEVFLNKTKRFPDFTDIMKLLESQSSSLGLPSNRESLRMIATEIFQQVGAMLQRRRKYDLWDSFCGFLDNQVDPANEDPVLDKILKDNYETRIKKEQEIFQHYAELQEKEKLEPEEVPEEEANRSPSESGNEDEIEIEEIENDINKRLDVAITADTKDEGNCASDCGDSKTEAASELPAQKESKNNFKNCKSLKWRSDNSGKSKSESGNTEDSSTEPEKEVRESRKVSHIDGEESLDSKESGKNDSDVDSCAAHANGRRTEKDETGTAPHEPRKECNSNGCEYYNVDDENSNCVGKSNDSFDVHYCHVFADNVFENFSEKKKHGERRKVFRDLTNVNRLMDLHGKSRAMSGLLVPSFFLSRSFRELEKTSWKRRFRLSYRLGAVREQKGAIGREDRAGKRARESGGDSDERAVRNNSEGGGDERDGFFSGHGGESHEDGDEDRNRKNGRTGDDLEESRPEEEDDEEEKDENETESLEHSQQREKTEESQETQSETDWPEGTRSDVQTAYDNHTEKKNTGSNNARETENEKIEVSENKTETTEKNGENKNSEVKEVKETDVTERSEDVEETENEKIEEVHQTEPTEEDEENDREVVETSDSDSRSPLSNKSELKEIEPLENVKCILEEKDSEDFNEEISSTIDGMRTVGVTDFGSCKSNEFDRIGNVTSRSYHSHKRLGHEMFPNSKEISTSRFSGDAGSQYKVGKKENWSISVKKTQDLVRPDVVGKSLMEHISPKAQRKTSTSDEEIVKRFLMHSPSSISITPPRKMSLSKPPSQAALQALATLRSLKGISATIVRGKPKTEGDVSSSLKRNANQKNISSPPKRGRSELPVISNVQSIYHSTPKIVTVQGNVSGFENPAQEPASSERTECDSTSIRISNVWGSLPKQPTPQNRDVTPGCSSYNYPQTGFNYQQSNNQPWQGAKKKSTKKKVEYVVLD